MSAAHKIYELHVQPTYAVYIPQRDSGSYIRSEEQRKNERNLTDNQHQGKLSPKAVRRLCNSVNWLVASAKRKYIYDKSTNKRYSFKVNFVTLTLPTTEHNITDHFFKSKLLHNFINTCRYKFDMKNFVWKVEAQENGNIHAHFTTDTFIHWKDLRSTWNRILIKNGIMDSYTQKHASMSFDDYCHVYDPKSERNIEQMRKSFNHGQTTNWQDPNSTDVHAVWAVKDIAAYLAKYMSKTEDERRPIKGRIWGCSYNLSSQNKLVLELHGSEDQDLILSLCEQNIKFKPLENIDKLTGQPFRFGEIFFYKLSDWGSVIKGRLLEFYNQHRFNIRYNIDINAQKNIHVHDLSPPMVLQVIQQNIATTQCHTPVIF